MNKLVIIIAGLTLLLGSVWWYTSITSMFGMNITEKGDLTRLLDDTVPEVEPTQIVTLKNGDTFNLNASIVKQEVGNRIIKRLAYNGQIPGPVIKVEKGSKITVNFTNNQILLLICNIPVAGFFDYEVTIQTKFLLVVLSHMWVIPKNSSIRKFKFVGKCPPNRNRVLSEWSSPVKL